MQRKHSTALNGRTYSLYWKILVLAQCLYHGLNCSTLTPQLPSLQICKSRKVVLFVSKQTMSLPPALSLFNQFGELSGYKLNLTKCVNVLGVSVTRKYKGQNKEKFIILSRWSPLSMSLVGRINSIKMCILPKFLYLFQALTIFIHASFFQQIDSIISSYIWQGKKTWLNKAQLQKPKISGGLAFPNFRFYYWAANLRCLVFWSYCYGKLDCPDWVTIEQHVNDAYSALAFLGSPLFSIKFSQNPVVQHSLKIWAQFRNLFGFHSFSLLSPITSNYIFKPASLDPGFQQW